MRGVAGHGVFVHQPDATMAALGGADGTVAAIRAMGMGHAWLRVHGRDGAWRHDANATLAAALRAGGIAVGVWGWCDGNAVDRDIANATAAIAAHDPDAYIADIEPGVRGARWSAADAGRFAAAVKARLGGRPLVVSGPGLLAGEGAAAMAAMDGSADAFAPQAYWFDGPDPALAAAEGVAPDDPAAFAGLCLRRWRRAVTKPLVVTGQAYWGEAPGWTQESAEARLAAFLERFDGWDGIAGLTWWNLAAPDAMSPRMRATIAAARIDRRFAQASAR
jgi:hypothetical protein